MKSGPKLAIKMKQLLRLFSFFFLFIIAAYCHAHTNISSIEPGESVSTTWQQFPVLIYKRTEKEIASLTGSNEIPYNERLHAKALQHVASLYGNGLASDLAATSSLETKKSRSIRSNILVVLGVSTNFGCVISFTKNDPKFEDPCSGAIYGTSGRIVEANNREDYHLLVPPHYYEDSQIILGHKFPDDVPLIDFSPDIATLKIPDGKKLLLAIEWQKEALVTQLLKNSSVLEYETSTGANALHVAASKGNARIIDELVAAGFLANSVSKNGITSVQIALISDNDDTAIALLSHGAKTDNFCIASRCADEVVDLLVKMKPSLSENSAQQKLASLKEKAL